MPTEGKRDKRMLIWICAIMAVLMSCQGGMAQEVGDSFRQSAKADCGAQAVYLLLSLHHKPVVIEDVISSFVDEDSAGHSMLELAQASSRLGLPAGPARTLDSLGKIICLRPGRFSCIPFSVLPHAQRTENPPWRTFSVSLWTR